MELVNTGLLYLLPLAGIPVLLHLLTLHRLKTVELSTFRFLFDSYVQQRRKMKFLEALLAMLRTLFLLLLVMVCARPVVRHWSALFGGGSGRDVVMMVDCSASMNASTNGVTALERAKSAARSVVDRLAAEDRLTLVRVATKPDEIFSRFSADSEAIGEHLDSLQSSPARGNWFAAFSQLFGPGAPERTTPTVYLFTDCQASGWKELASQGVERLVPENTRLVVVNVGSTDPLPNVAVIGMPPRQHKAIVGLPLTLRPRVANYSKTDTAGVALSVFVDEKEVSRSSLTIKPGDSADKELVFVPTEPGILKGRFQIGEDRFADDDQYLFTLSVAPQIKVLLVNGNPSADPFENEVLYLRTALTASNEDEADATATPAAAPPDVNKPPELGPSKEYLRSLDVQDMLEGNLTAETLSDVSVLVLANCGGLNAQQFGFIRDFVGAGGGLLIFPGDRVNPDVYNQQFFPVAGPQQERLVSAQIGQPVGDAQKYESFVRLTQVDFAHPVLSVFDDPDSRYLTTANFYRRFMLLVDEKRTDCWPMARFSPKEPAIVESRFRDGMVILAAFPASTKWTNLPLKPEFVPLVLRMVNHVEHRRDFETPSVVAADGAAEIAVAGTWTPAVGKVTDMAGHTADIEFQRSGSRLVGAFEKTALKGFYTVEVQGGRVEQPKRATASFAVNLAPEESQFVSAGEDQMREWLPGVELSMIDASAQAQQELGAIGDEREIWRPLLAAMFLIIGIEFMLATLGGQRVDTDTDDDTSVGERIRQFSPGTWVGRMTGATETAASN